MKVLFTRSSNIEYIKTVYKSFTKNCIKFPNEAKERKDEFLHIEAMCRENNQLEPFYQSVQKLGEHLEKTGKMKLANIIFGELSKIYVNMGKTGPAEKIIEKAIRISNAFEDKMHVFSRLTDLEILYKNERNGKKLYPTLIRKIECGKEILTNYEQYAKNFNSISRKPMSQENIKVQLAFAYSDLANMIKHKKTSHSIKLLRSAQNIHQELNHSNEVRYLEKKISFLKEQI